MDSCFEQGRSSASMPFPKWVERDFNIAFKKFNKSVKSNSEIVYSNLAHFEEYKDKTVLIIGGGPSTNKLDYDSTERDFTWSCNHFYLNPIISSLKVDVAMFMGEPDLKCKEFIEYRDRFKPYSGFEIHKRWFDYNFDDYEKYFAMHTRFYSRLGACVRMIIFASFLESKTVKFVGLDGYEPIYNGDHAHQPGKKLLPNNFSESFYNAEYKYFWEYTKGLFPNTEYINLGYGKRFHK